MNKDNEYKRVSKKGLENYTMQKTLFEKNETAIIYIIPSKANLYSEWISFIKMDVNINNLETKLNEASYYNCNAELGNSLHYYIKL